MEQQQSSAGEEINQPYSHFEKMNPSFFRKYIAHFRLPIDPSLPKEELCDLVGAHFANDINIDVDEAIKKFLLVKRDGFEEEDTRK